MNEALVQLIKQHTLLEAQESDWDAVSAKLNAKTVEVRKGKVGGKASLTALKENSIDPNVVIAAMRSVPISSELLDTLIVGGVDWADELTKYVMASLVDAGKTTKQVADVMLGLSLQYTSLAGVDVTAAECKAAWGCDELTSIWTTALNDGGINQALAAGDRDALKAALLAVVEVL